MTIKVKLRNFYKEATLHVRVFWAAIKAFLGIIPPIAPVGRLYAEHITHSGTKDLGLISTKVVTNVGVAFIVDAFQNLAEVDLMKYHAAGISINAESQTDTQLGAEQESRAIGTSEEGATANVYKTVATIPYTAAHAITEHGIFSDPALGTLLDRSVFSPINVDAGESVKFTYELTFAAGS